jgi:thioredoxin reductase
LGTKKLRTAPCPPTYVFGYRADLVALLCALSEDAVRVARRARVGSSRRLSQMICHMKPLIVGAGPAGLSAALVLARCRRRVLVCGTGKPRNHASHGIRGLLGQEGQLPADFIATGVRDLERYPTLERRDVEVIPIRVSEGEFSFTCADGSGGSARKILLATGLRDELPAIPGIETLYGCSVHHCLYCDGFEYADKPITAYGEGDKGAGLALMMKQWSTDVILCADGRLTPSTDMQKRLATHGVPILEAPIAARW